MKWTKWLLMTSLAFCLSVGVGMAQQAPPPKKLTCCQKADAEKKECKNKCCVAAHRQNKSCEKCNPGKEDLAILKKRQQQQQQQQAKKQN